MYRDDLEATQARVRTLEAELEAEQQHRAAAEAEVDAANAARDEARLEAKRSHKATGSGGRLTTVVPISVAAGVLLTWAGFSLFSIPSAMDPKQSLEEEATRRRLGKLKREVKQLRKLNEAQGLMLRRQARRRSQQPLVIKRALSRTATDARVDRSTLGEASNVLLSRASEAYVKGNYVMARELARGALEVKYDNQKALQILGASACFLKDRFWARRAYQRLVGDQRKQLLRKICLRGGVQLE